MTTSPTVLLSIEDPVLRLDVSMAFSDAGYEVVDPCAFLRAGLPVDVALIDADPPGRLSAPLAKEIAARDIPCLVFSSETSGDRLAQLPKARFLQKPLASEALVSYAAQLGGRSGLGWRAPAGKPGTD